MSVGGFDIGGTIGSFASDFADFATDFAADFTSDFGLDSFTNGFGTEFLTDIGTSVVDFGGDLFSGAGEFFGDISGSLYEQVGSFAGDATWFNATNFGSIVSGPGAGFTEFFGSVGDSFSGITNYLSQGVNAVTSALPSPSSITPALTSIVTGGSPVSLATPGIVGSSGFALPGIGSILSTPGGLNPSIVPGIGGGGISIPGLSGIRTAPSAATSFYRPVSSGVPSATSLLSVATGINPALINVGAGVVDRVVNLGTSAVDTGLTFISGTAQAQTPRSSSAALVNTDIDPNWRDVPQIDITGVGVNLSDQRSTIVGTERGSNFAEIFNPETQQYDVYDLATNTVVQSGLSQQQAILAAQDLNIQNPAIEVATTAANVGYEAVFDPLTGKYNVVDVNNGQTIASGLDEQEAILLAQDQSVIDGGSTPADEDDGAVLLNDPNLDSVSAGSVQSLINQARQQQALRAQRQNKAQAGDWRVRLQLAPNSNYLYNAPDCGPVLWPLRNTDGIIFPYTPTIDTAYKANYSAYDLTHSNYRGYFYQNSYVDGINVKATFTAQDTSEANYLLAVIHFFRSATKMFYGQDQEALRGAPPPLVYISGYGDYQFAEHPCVISQFNYSLPSDVDYIRAQVQSSNGTNLLVQRNRQGGFFPGISPRLQQLLGVGISLGALDSRAAAPTLGQNNPTYVPTKMEISIVLLPMQTRQQVSKQFSLKNFANGNLLKGGFW